MGYNDASRRAKQPPYLFLATGRGARLPRTEARAPRDNRGQHASPNQTWAPFTVDASQHKYK